MKDGAWSLMVPAFVECLVLVGIHSYLGLHVIKRKVIFVDLALAQIAALGATVGFLFGMSPSSPAAFLFSMLFTFLGAAVFAATRLSHDRVPQEAVIGLVYALAASIAILVVDTSPQGAEHIKDLLTGTILWVQWDAIISSALAYSAIGVFHYLLRHRFIRITEDPAGAFAAGIWVRLWDFLFYLSFGVVISFSVRTAGVLLVFVFLVAPAITAVLLTDSWRLQLVVGWAMGTLVTTVALYFSYRWDLPSGPSVVAFYGAVLLVVALLVGFWRAGDRRRAGLRLAAGVGATGLVIGAVWLLGAALGHSSLAEDAHHPHSPYGHRPHDHQPHHHDPREKPGAHRDAGLPSHDPGQLSDAGVLLDPALRLTRLRAAIAAKRAGWRAALVETVLDPQLPLLYQDEALTLLREQAGSVFGFGSASAAPAEVARKLRAWARRSASASGDPAAGGPGPRRGAAGR